MPDLKERFIDLAVKPFGEDIEQRLGARQWIDEQTACASETDLKAAIARWEKDDRRGNAWALFRKAQWIVALSVVIGLMFPALLLLREAAYPYQALGGYYMLPGWLRMEERLVSDAIDPADRLLIGDQRFPRIAQKEKLWRSDPANPAFFAEYAATYLDERNSLPPDYFETVEKIDPENAWFDYLAAISLLDRAIEPDRLTEKEREQGIAPSWKILKEVEVKEALEFVRRARGKEGFSTYHEDVLRRRIPLLPQKTPVWRITSIGYVLGNRNPIIDIRRVGALIAAEAWRLGEEGDKDGFRELQEDALEYFCRMRDRQDTDLFGELVFVTASSQMLRNLQASAEKLDLLDEKPELSLLNAAFLQANDRRKKRQVDKGNAASVYLELVQYQGSEWVGNVMVSAVLDRLESPPAILEEDLKPGRLAEHAVYSMMFSIGISLWCGVCLLGLFFYRFRAPANVRTIAARMETLISSKDLLWITVGGVIVPAIGIVAILFTPLGGRNLSVGGWRWRADPEWLAPPLIHFILLALIVTMLPVLLTRWRLSRKMDLLGFSKGSWSGSWIGRALWVSLVIWIVSHLRFLLPWMPEVLLGALLLWLSITIGLAVFHPSKGLLRRQVIARSLIPHHLAVMGIMTIAAFGFYFENRMWLERDPFMKLDAEKPAMIPYEYIVARQLKAETRAALPER